MLLEHKHKLDKVLLRIFYVLYRVTEEFFSYLNRDDALGKVGSVAVTPLFIDIKILRENGDNCRIGEIIKFVNAVP